MSSACAASHSTSARPSSADCTAPGARSASTTASPVAAPGVASSHAVSAAARGAAATVEEQPAHQEACAAASTAHGPPCDCASPP